MSTDHPSTPAPFQRQAEALHSRARKLQKKGVSEKIEALIKEWYPPYYGKFGDIFRRISEDLQRQQPCTTLILWYEQVDREYLNREGLPSMFGFILDRRAVWRTGYNDMSGIREGLAALALFRGLDYDRSPSGRFSVTYTLTVEVEPPYAEQSLRPSRPKRYIDIETGREWQAQAWLHARKQPQQQQQAA